MEDYQSVYKIEEIEDFVKSRSGDLFISQFVRDKLIKSPEEYKVLHFLNEIKNKEYSTLYGGVAFCCWYSAIKGPFTSPQISDGNKEEYAFHRFIPSNYLLYPYKNIELISYGCGLNLGDYIVNYKDFIKKISNEAFDILKKKCNLNKAELRDGRSGYRCMIEDCLIEFFYNCEYKPVLDTRIFGFEQTPSKVRNILGLNQFDEVFLANDYHRILEVRCKVEKGIAYGLSFKKNDSINEILSRKNIVLV